MRRLLPESANLIDEIVQAIGPDHRPITAISHGDFHEAQLLVSGGRLRGVLDIDTHGRGRPGDDPATMLGHLSVLEHSSPQPGRVAAYRKALHQRWDGLVDPADLRLRSAAVIAGPRHRAVPGAVARLAGPHARPAGVGSPLGRRRPPDR